MKRIKLLLTLALPVLMLSNVEARSGADRTSSTSTISRLIGIGDYVNNGAGFYVTDSTSLGYTNGRGGDLTHVMKYDNMNYFVYNGSDSLFDPSTQNDQVFDASNNISTNVLQGWGGTAIGWVPQTKNLYFYNVANNITSMIFQNWNTGSGVWVSATKDDYTYLASGTQLFSDIYSMWNSVSLTFDQSSEKIYSYDVHGNMIQELDNTNIGTSWTPVQEYVYTYNAANQPLTKTFDTWNGGGYTHNYRFSYSYDVASGNLISSLYQTYNTDSSSWINANLSLYSNFSGSNPQTQEDRVWNDTMSGGSWMPSMLWSFTYNTYAQMTSKLGTSYNLSLPGYENAAGDPLSYYHYEAVAVNAVKNVNDNNFAVSVFPVPAQNMLHINVTSASALSYDVMITDMAGRIVRSWKTDATASYTTTIPTGDFVAGNYLVKISSVNGQTTQQFSVIH